MAYKKEKVIKAIEQALKAEDYLYKSDFVNYSGKIEDGEGLYTEVAAEYLLKHTVFLKDIKELKRERSYNVSHNIEKREDISDRHEELFASRLKGKYLNYLGKVIDFQVPLKPAKKEYKGVGKIDLLSIAKCGSKAYIVELKYGNNKETLLKTVLEIAYYERWLWKEKFLADFEKELGDIRPSDIKKAVLLGVGTRSWEEAKDLKNRPNLSRLIADLGVEVFFINGNRNIKPIEI